MGNNRIQKLSKLSIHPPLCVPVLEYPELEDWVHDSGRLIVLGDAAHPMTVRDHLSRQRLRLISQRNAQPGGIQAAAMALEDGAVLAKLFSHIRTSDQIPTLLYAYQDLRQPHVRRVQQKDLSDLHFQCMAPGEVQQGRDDFMRAQRDAGRSPLAPAGADEEELPEWTEIKDVFGYDAEDDADNWWVEWGLLRERARGTDIKMGFVEPIAIRQGVSTSTTSLPLDLSDLRCSECRFRRRLPYHDTVYLGMSTRIKTLANTSYDQCGTGAANGYRVVALVFYDM